MSFLTDPIFKSIFPNQFNKMFGGLGETLFGTKGETKQLPTMSPEQMEFFQNFLSQIGGAGAGGFGESMDYLRNILSGDPEAMRAFEAPHLRQFQEQTVPALTERLTGLGAGGGRSSGAAQVLGQAGQSLQEKLASLRSGLQGQAAQQLMGTYLQGAGLGTGARPFGYQYEPGREGLFGALAGGLGQGLGSGFGGGLGTLLAGLI